MEEKCPFCGTNLQGDAIPQEHQEAYGGATHFSRKVGISNGDSVYAWECPDCHKSWWRHGEEQKPGSFRTFNVEVKGAK